MSIANVLAELQRRRVFRVLVGYGVVSFALLQVIEPIMHALHLPDALLTYCVVALGLGFPIAVMLAWAFDVRGGKIERTGPAAGPWKGARLALLLCAIGFAAAAPGLAWYFLHARSPAAAPVPEPVAQARMAPSIAVMPFANLSSDKEQEYFSDGIAEEILNALAHVEGLRVIGRTSSFAFKGKSEELSVIAQKLRVGSLLEGSVRREAGRVRVSAKLIDAAEGTELWAESFDRQVTGVFAVQDEIARAVVAALKARMLPGATPALPPPPATTEEAYSAFLLGRFQEARSSQHGEERAVTEFQRAVTLDPDYAPAWAWLAHAQYWSVQYETTAEQQARLQRQSRSSAERAVALSPASPEAHAVRGFLRLAMDYDWSGAESDLQQALAAAPGDAGILRIYGRFLLAPQGRLREALLVLEKATGIDPLSSQCWVTRARVLFFSGRIEEATAAVRRAVQLAPEDTIAGSMLADLLAQAGKVDEARAVVRGLAQGGWRLFATFHLERAAGDPAAADRALAELERTEAGTMAAQIAMLHAARGDTDLAFDWIERARRQQDGGLSDVWVAPDFRSLRGDPRFQRLLEAFHLSPVEQAR